MKKRILSILLTFCMVLMIVPKAVFAANEDAIELQNLLNGGGTVTLEKDYTIDTTLNVTDKTVTLDLNGHTISMTGSGSVIYVGSGGDLTVKGSSNPSTGVITGGNASNGGGVYNIGSFTMTGGTIEACRSTDGDSDAVFLLNNASLLANGGKIKDTVRSYGAIQNTSGNGCTVFYDAVNNYGTISGGIYYGGIQNLVLGIPGTDTYYTVSFDLNGGSGTVPPHPVFRQCQHRASPATCHRTH